jgi:hypothetical protein
MILIPALGRTRSSLVAGIFEASGAWVGSSTVSMINVHDTFENWDVIMYLQKKFALRGPMHEANARRYAPEFHRFVMSIIPEDRVVCLKFVWYYDLLFRYAFPDADYYFVSRTVFPKRKKQRKKIAFDHYKSQMRGGTWIDTELLHARDFSEIKPIIDQHSALKWNQQGVDALYASNGAAKYKTTAKVNR